MKMRKTSERHRAATRVSLATAARRLNRVSGCQHLPPLLLVTDERWLGDPTRAIFALPRGAGVIFRHYGDPERARRALDLARLCRAQRLVFLVAGDAGLAAGVRADGVHLPEYQIGRARALRRARPRWLITVAVHGETALCEAAKCGAEAALLAPVFATASHSGRKPLGPLRFAALVRHAALPVYALGGIDEESAKRLTGSGTAGLAALSAFLP